MSVNFNEHFASAGLKVQNSMPVNEATVQMKQNVARGNSNLKRLLRRKYADCLIKWTLKLVLELMVLQTNC